MQVIWLRGKPDYSKKIHTLELHTERPFVWPEIESKTFLLWAIPFTKQMCFCEEKKDIFFGKISAAKKYHALWLMTNGLQLQIILSGPF